MSTPYKCEECSSLGLTCVYHQVCAKSTNEGLAQSGVTTEDYSSSPAPEMTIQTIMDTYFATADMHLHPMFNPYQSGPPHAPDPMYSIEDRAEAVPPDLSTNECHTPGTKLADVVQTPKKQLASSSTAAKSANPSCPSDICQWHDEGAGSEKCGDEISCESVPKHFKDVHGIKNKGESELIRCRWEWCFLELSRKNFARHIRECHLNHIRDQGH